MKNFNILILSISILVFNLNIYGQCCPALGPITLKPNSPTINDSIQIYTRSTIPDLGYKLSKNHYIKNDTIFLEGCYHGGIGQTPIVFYDTFNVQKLNSGNYTIFFTGHYTFDPNCKSGLSQTKTMNFSVKKTNMISYFSKAKIAIYPNPANQKQTMVIQSATPQSLNIDLYDISGQLIKNVYAGKACIGEQQFDVDISNISNGIYFYKVSIGDSELHYKFIKQ